MKKLISLFALLILGSNLSVTALAATLCEVPSPKLIISKFSFNSVADFVEITVIDDGNSGGGTILNGWKIGTIDSTLATLTDFSIQTSQAYSFKDIPGLTGTTEQIVILNEKGEIKDAVCWTSATPTEQEKTDFLKLGAEWSGNISNCLSSDNLEKETIFTRTAGEDTNTALDWKKAGSLETPVILPEEEEGTPETPAHPIATNEIIINELLPDPDGSDEGAEWIELKNTSDHTVSLQGWKLDDIEGGSKPYAFKNEVIGPESFLLMSNSVTNVTLNNTSDSARLIDGNDKVISQYAYTKVETGKSWARKSNGTFELTADTTPGEENQSATSEESEEDEEGGDEGLPPEGTPIPVDISEVFPNPEGADSGSEWIEIHNTSAAVIQLDGWKIRNAAGKTFTFPENTSIEAQGYMTISDQTTKIQLKNTGDQIWLIDADGTVQDTIELESAPENVSFAHISTIGIDDEAGGETDTQGKAVTANTAAKWSWKNWLIPSAHAQSESEWEWTDIITKGKPNPVYYRITGSITRGLDEKNTFDIERNGKVFTVEVDPKKIQIDLIKAIAKVGERIEVTAAGKEGALVLETYKTTNETSAPTSSSILTTLLVSIGIILAAAGAWFFKLHRETISQEILQEVSQETVSQEPTHPHDPASSEPDHTPAHKFPEERSAWPKPEVQILFPQNPRQ